MVGRVGRLGVRTGGLALLLAELLSEGLAQVFGCLAVDLAREDVADGVEDDIGLLLRLVSNELALVLGSEDYGHLVASRRGNEVVQTFYEDGRKLV